MESDQNTKTLTSTADAFFHRRIVTVNTSNKRAVEIEPKLFRDGFIKTDCGWATVAPMPNGNGFVLLYALKREHLEQLPKHQDDVIPKKYYGTVPTWYELVTELKESDRLLHRVLLWRGVLFESDDPCVQGDHAKFFSGAISYAIYKNSNGTFSVYGYRRKGTGLTKAPYVPDSSPHDTTRLYNGPTYVLAKQFIKEHFDAHAASDGLHGKNPIRLADIFQGLSFASLRLYAVTATLQFIKTTPRKVGVTLVKQLVNISYVGQAIQIASMLVPPVYGYFASRHGARLERHHLRYGARACKFKKQPAFCPGNELMDLPFNSHMLPVWQGAEENATLLPFQEYVGKVVSRKSNGDLVLENGKSITLATDEPLIRIVEKPTHYLKAKRFVSAKLEILYQRCGAVEGSNHPKDRFARRIAKQILSMPTKIRGFIYDRQPHPSPD